MAWTYTQGGDGRIRTMKTYATRHERVLWFTKPGHAHVFNPTAIATKYTEEQKKVARQKGTGRLREDSLDKGKPPWSWWTAPRVNSNSSERKHGAHPSMKPLEVARRLILAHSPPDGTVVIPFAGSGSELVECARTEQRTCVAFKVDPTYAAITKKRVNALADDK